jgi:hypothetical protein
MRSREAGNFSPQFSFSRGATVSLTNKGDVASAGPAELLSPLWTRGHYSGRVPARIVARAYTAMTDNAVLHGLGPAVPLAQTRIQ